MVQMPCVPDAKSRHESNCKALYAVQQPLVAKAVLIPDSLPVN